MTHITVVVERQGGLSDGSQGPSERLPAGRRRARGTPSGTPTRLHRRCSRRTSRIRQLVTQAAGQRERRLVEIERGINHVTVTVHTAKPGIVIGKGGANVEALRQQIGKLTTRKVKLEIKEIRQPELDAVLVAANIAQQLTRRIAFRKAIKQAIQRTMKAGAKGVRIAGRRAASAARRWPAASGTRKAASRSARCAPTSATARCTPTRPTARIGVKVWIYRGDMLPERTAPHEARPQRPRERA